MLIREASMRRLGCLVAACGIAMGLSGCGSDATVTSGSSQPVEVFSWWASGGDGAALAALIAVYQQQHSGATVTNSAMESQVSDLLVNRFKAGSPPDLFQEAGGRGLCGNWVTTSQVYVTNLDAFAAQQRWTDVTVMPQTVQDSARCTGPDGLKHFYGVPVDIHRANTLFYNKKIFASAGIASPPASVEEFFQVAGTLKQQRPDIAPLALGTTAVMGGPWTLSVILESLIAGMHGASWYLKFYTGQADLSSSTTDDWVKLRAAFDSLARVLEYVNPNFQDISWAAAADMLRTDQAAMTVIGDWANGIYASQGWSAVDGYGGRSAFGNAFALSTDVLALPLGAKNSSGAMAFLGSTATTDGQNAFNRIKGGIPPCIATLDASFTEYARSAAADFAAAGDQLVPVTRLITPDAFTNAITTQMSTFQNDKNVDAMMLAIRNSYASAKEQ